MDELDNVLFAPRSLAAMTETKDGHFSSNRLKVCYRNRNSATLVFESQNTGEITSLILDLAASVERQKKDLDGAGNFSSFHYDYSRYGVLLSFEVTPWWWQSDVQKEQIEGENDQEPEEDPNDSINALEFVFSQFTYTLFSAAKVGTSSADEEGSVTASDDGGLKETTSEVALTESEKANTHVVASAFEIAGKGVRKGLKYSGQGVGTAIRYLGAGYTSAAVTLGGAGSHGPREVHEEDIAYAKQQKENGETFHAGARSVTGTILAPVRYIGMKAQTFASDKKTSTFEEGSNQDNSASMESSSGSQSHEKGVGEQILWGMGNGFVHAFKGITEFVSEIGQAVGDTALHHSTVVNGEDFAQRVTKVRLEGAGQVGLGLYKVGNVFAFGVAGIAADAVFEGGVLLTSLYDFLVGPVLLHAHMDVAFPPSTELQRVYVVLRPWSVSFYEKSTQFTAKPFRIIPTSLLDTLPQLRLRTAPTQPDSGPLENQSNASRAFASGDVSSRASLMRLEESGFAGTKESSVPRPSESIIDQLVSTKSHVELCTVDCSTALLHPLIEQNSDGDPLGGVEAALQDWFHELKEACGRVEEVQKQHSGADEIAIGRRLRMLPHKQVLWIELGKLFVKRDRGNYEENDEARSLSTDSLDASGAAIEMLPTGSVVSAPPQSDDKNDCDGVSKDESSKNVSTASVSLRGGKTTLKDTFANASLRSAKIRVYPVTTRGLRVAPEELWTKDSRSLTTSKDTDGALEADFEQEHLEMGHNASLDASSASPDGIASLLLTVKAHTIYGRENAEIGRVHIPLRNLAVGNVDDQSKEANLTKKSLSLKLHRRGQPSCIVGSVQVIVGVIDQEEKSASI